MEKGLEIFNLLVIEPNIERRNRMWTACQAIPNFSKIEQVRELVDGLQLLKGRRKIDIVFISPQFELELSTAFLKAAKATKQGRICAYVSILDGGNVDVSTAATSTAAGTDAFLAEPFSVDSLLEIARLAAETIKRYREELEEAAMKTLVAELMTHLDILVQYRAIGKPNSLQMKKLVKLTGIISKFEQDKQQLYFRTCLEMFPEARTPEPLSEKLLYSGISKRLKRRIEDKLVRELEAKTTNDEQLDLDILTE
jgi:hypothetical protein